MTVYSESWRIARRMRDGLRGIPLIEECHASAVRLSRARVRYNAKFVYIEAKNIFDQIYA